MLAGSADLFAQIRLWLLNTVLLVDWRARRPDWPAQPSLTTMQEERIQSKLFVSVFRCAFPFAHRLGVETEDVDLQ